MEKNPPSNKKQEPIHQWPQTRKYINKKVGQELQKSHQNISEELKKELRGELSKQVSRRLDKVLEKHFSRMQHEIQGNRFVYGFFAGVGILLFWYGAWQVLPRIPFLNEGVNAFVIGFIFLVFSGALFKKASRSS